MTKANILPSLTWNHTGANSVDIEIKDIKLVEHRKNINNKAPEEFEKVFLNENYGVSKEILELNKKYNNYQEYYEFNSDENINKKIVLDKNFDTLNDIHNIKVKEGADSTIILDYVSDEKVFRNTLIKISAEKNSNVKIVLIQRLSKDSESFLSLISNVAEKANVHLVQIELGAKKSYSNYKVNLNEINSESDIKMAYFVDDDRYLDIAYLMRHFGKESLSDMLIHGVLKDNAVKRFQGTLDFRRGCTLSKGNEEEYVTLLDPTVKSRAVPVLLAREDDIMGNHAASAGRIDKELLFYIQSRGFDALEAKKIIIESKIKPILDYIGDKELEKELLEKIRREIA